jgi:hypothetical protein
MWRDERAVCCRCVVIGAPKRIWRVKRGRVARRVRRRENIAVWYFLLAYSIA